MLTSLARLELRRFTGAGRLRRAALVAVVLVPLLYGGTYLWAFWDPDGGLDRLPVALAVEDVPAAGPDGPVQAGADLAAELERREVFAWRRMDAEQAQAAVDDGRYAVALIVPRDFSATLVRSATGRPAQAALEVHTNDAVNYLAGRLGTAVLREVRDAATADVTRGYLSSIFVASDERLAAVRTAADGAGELATGLTGLTAGSAALAQGAGEAVDGAQELATGVSATAAGARTLATGAASAREGSAQLAEGLGTLRERTAALPPALAALAAGAAASADGAAASRAAAGRLAGAAAAVDTTSGDLDAALRAYAASRQPADLDRALSLAAQLGSATGPLAEGVARAAQAQDPLAAGTRSVADGLADVSGRSGPLAEAVATAADGSTTLRDGVGDVAAGSQALSAALDRARGGAEALRDGTTRLAEGSSALADGVSTASAGGGALAAGLRSGVEAAPALDGGSAGHAAVMSDPVRLDAVAVNAAPTYGTGLSPYFLPLALWVGSWLAYLFLAPLNRRAVAAGAAAWRVAVAGWLPVALLSVAQVAVLLTVLRLGLGLQPASGVLLTGFLALSGLTFAAVLQMLTALLGPRGRLLGIVVLVLQLVTAGGTYPVETQPAPLRWLSPLLPMTHMVRGLRGAVLDGDLDTVAGPAAVLLAYLLGALALSTLAAARARRWTPTRLWPDLDLVVR